MNVIAQTRSSAIAHATHRVPAIRASQLFTEQQLSLTRFYAGMPQRAQAVVDFLAPYANRGPLDQELASILKKARASASRHRMH